MRKLIINGEGILGQDVALQKRGELNLNYWDYSADPIILSISPSVEHLSSKFIFYALKDTAYRCFDEEIPMCQNIPLNLMDEETGRFPLCIGPYVLKLDESNEHLMHHIYGAMGAGWSLHWQRDRRLDLQSKSPLALKR